MEDSKHERNNVRDEGYYAQSWKATGRPHPLLWETCTTLAIKETINKSEVALGATMFLVLLIPLFSTLFSRTALVQQPKVSLHN